MAKTCLTALFCEAKKIYLATSSTTCIKLKLLVNMYTDTNKPAFSNLHAKSTIFSNFHTHALKYKLCDIV